MANKKFLLEELTEEDREWFRVNGKEKLILPNEKIITAGETPQEIGLVVSGLFAIISENGEHISIIGPGGVLGMMTFLTETIASVSVVAVEPDSVVFTISRKTLAIHLLEDLNFAVRFYRATATFLSDRLKNLLDSFVTHPKTKIHKRGVPQLLGPVPLFNHEELNFDLIHRILESSPSIVSILKNVQADDNYDALIKREHQLSVATMAAESIRLLCDLAKEEGINDFDRRVIHHQPSMTAAEKQIILKDFLIQKTITILIENKFVLCSGTGDFKIQHKLLSKIATVLGLPRGTFDSYINPAVFAPEIELGLLRGMVSTFFSPGRLTQLSLVSFITPPPGQMGDVAISLSLFESLILPGELFPRIVKKYAERAYPYLPFALLSMDNDNQ